MLSVARGSYPGPDYYSNCIHRGNFNTAGDTWTGLGIKGTYGSLPPAYVAGDWYFQRGYGGQVGSFGSYSNNPTGFGLWSAGKPNTISVTVRRIDCVTMNGGSISVHADVTSASAEFQVQKFGDGFPYNKVVPADKLLRKELQTNLFQPFT